MASLALSCFSAALLAASVPAQAAIHLGTVGDSLTDEYLAADDRAANDLPAQNWVQILADSRPGVISFGRYRPDPVKNWQGSRDSGFEYNWAKSGSVASDATMLQAAGMTLSVHAFGATYASEQARDLAKQVASRQVDTVFVGLGANDFYFRGNIFTAADGSHTPRPLEQLDLPKATADVTAGILAAVDTALAAGEPAVLVALVRTQEVFGTDARSLAISAAVDAINDNLRAAVAERAAVGHRIGIVDLWGWATDPNDPHHFLQDDVVPIGAQQLTHTGASSAELLPAGSEGASTLCRSDGQCATAAYAAHFTSEDGLHPNTLIQALMANQVIKALNSYFAAGIRPLSDDDIVALGWQGYQAAGALNGSALAVADMNGDGIEDRIVAAPMVDALVDGRRLRAAGVLRVIDGRSQQVMQTFYGTAAQQHWGAAVAVVADQDGDSVPDLVVGEPTRSGGRVVLYSGQTGLALRTLVEAPAGSSQFGAALALGDVDGDGVPELAVGAPATAVSNGNTRLAAAGQVLVYHHLGEQLLYSRIGNEAGGQFGAALALDARWLRVGAPGHDRWLTRDGRPQRLVDAGAVAIFPAHHGYNGAWLTLEGEQRGQRLGVALSLLAGDSNSDGEADWAAGSPGLDCSTGKACGNVSVYSGLSPELLYHVDGQLAGDRFGSAIAGLAALAGDGSASVLVGAPRAKVGRNGSVLRDAGRVETLAVPVIHGLALSF